MNVQTTIEAINALPDDPTMWLDYTKDGTSTGEFMDSRHLKALVAANELLQRKLDRAMECVTDYANCGMSAMGDCEVFAVKVLKEIEETV